MRKPLSNNPHTGTDRAQKDLPQRYTELLDAEDVEYFDEAEFEKILRLIRGEGK